MLALLAAATALPRPSRAQPGPAIRIAGSTTDPYMVPYYAVETGTFARANLNVELTTQPTVAAVVQAVAAGAADVGQGDPIQLANAINRGLPFAVFAGGGLYLSNPPSIALAVAKNAPFRTAHDLEGQTVGVVTLNSLSAIGVIEWLRRNDVDPAKVKMIEIPLPQMPAAIGRGLIQAAFVPEPFLSFSTPELRVFAKTYDAIAPAFYLGCWFATKEWLAKNAEAARRLTAAIYETARWANAHHAETAAILAKIAKLDVELVRKMARTEYATTLDAKLMDPVLEDAYRYKTLEKPLTAADLVGKPG